MARARWALIVVFIAGQALSGTIASCSGFNHISIAEPTWGAQQHGDACRSDEAGPDVDGRDPFRREPKRSLSGSAAPAGLSPKRTTISTSMSGGYMIRAVGLRRTPSRSVRISELLLASIDRGSTRLLGREGKSGDAHPGLHQCVAPIRAARRWSRRAQGRNHLARRVTREGD